ncbi:MAG: hypothetical protein IID32_00895 [Planctomycetes bacterium]|nr:hypothetical protein [Planctomycetota bacterium]
MNTKSLKNRTAKCTLTICILFISAQLALANHHLANERKGITGTWQVELNYSNDRQGTAWLAVQENKDNSLAAKWIDSSGITDLENITFKDNHLAFMRTFKWTNRDGEERNFEINYTFTLKDNKLDGTVTTSRGETAASGSRYKHAPSPVGTWDVEMKFRERTFNSKLTITENPEGKLSGKWMSRRGESAISDINFKGNKLTFTRTSTYQDRTRESTFAGTIHGQKLTGQFTSERGSRDANGKREHAGLVGHWLLKTTNDQGRARTRLLSVHEDLSATYHSWSRQYNTDLHIEDENISFKLTMRRRNNEEYPLEFKGKLEGKQLIGELIISDNSSKATGQKINLNNLFAKPKKPESGKSKIL